MAATREHLVTCGTGKTPAGLPLDRTRIIPPPPPSAGPLSELAQGEAEARLGRLCTISYHPHLSARRRYTRAHVDGATGDGHGARV